MNAEQFQRAFSNAIDNNFLIKMAQMEEATALLKSKGPIEGAKSFMAKLRLEARMAFEYHEDAIDMDLLRSLCRKRDLKTVGDKRKIAKRLLRNANYYDALRPSDRASHQSPRKRWTGKETKAFLEGYEKYGHSKWVQIKEHSPKLKRRSNVQIKDKARTMIKRGDLMEMYK